MCFTVFLSKSMLRLLPLAFTAGGIMLASVDQGGYWYVLNSDPPSVAKVESYKTIGTAALNAEPAHAIAGRDGRFLYVLEKGALSLSGNKFDDYSEVAIVDTASMTVVKRLRAGWRAHKMLLSQDGGHIALLSTGKRRSKNSDEEFPQLTIISTRTQEITARPSLRLSSVTYRPDISELANAFGLFALSNPTRFLLYDAGRPGGDDEVLASLTMFGVNSEVPIARATFDFGGFLYLHAGDDNRPFIQVSADEKWVYVVEHGKLASALKGTLLGKMLRKNKSGENGRVHILDTATLRTQAAFDVGYTPGRPLKDMSGVLVTSQGPSGEGRSRLYRFAGDQQTGVWNIGNLPRFVANSSELNGLLVVSMDELTPLRYGSSAPDPYVPLRRNRLRDGDAQLPEQIDCAPSPSLAVLPKISKVVLGLDKYELTAMDFMPEDKVAVVDMKERQLRIVDVGRGGV
jgi:hypothetical protein